MAVSTSTTLASLLPEIVAEAIFQANEQSLMRSLVRNFNIPAGSGNTIKVPVYPTFTAVAGAEATAFPAAPTTVNTGSVQLTAGEVGMSATVSDIAMIGASSNVIADIGGQFGRGIAQKIDEDLCALFDGFTTNVVGDGSAAISAADIFKAIAKLRTLKVPASNMFCVIHPEIAYDLKDNLTNTFANPNDGLSTEVMRNSFVGTLGGVPVYESAAIANTGTAGDYKGAVFHRDALGLAMMKDITIETQRESTLRADTITASAVYGVGELIDSYGVELHNLSSLT